MLIVQMIAVVILGVCGALGGREGAIIGLLAAIAWMGLAYAGRWMLWTVGRWWYIRRNT